MRGSVIKRTGKNGAVYYDIVFDAGRDPVTGKRKQKWLRGFNTKKDAEKALAQAIAEVERGTYLEPVKITVGEYLRYWLDHVRHKVAPKTVDGYANIIEKHLVPALGSILLCKLQPLHLQRYYEQSLREGRKDTKKSLGPGLSTQTVLHHHRVLHSALEQAVKWQLVARNVADAVEPPRPQRGTPAAVTEEEALAVLDALRDTYAYTPVLLALGTGMRMGEILGLRWQDADLNAGVLYLRQTYQKAGGEYIFRPAAKTKGSIRPVPVPPFVVRELKAHRKQQLEWKLKAGSAWQDFDLICTMQDGTPIKPTTLSKYFGTVARSLGLRMKFHDLRHAHATLLLKWGVHPKIVAERLGHSTTRLTLDTYSHVTPTMQDEAVKLLEENLFARRMLAKR